MTTTLPAPTTTQRRTSHARQMRLALVAAFTLSVTHTVYAELAGLAAPGFTVAMPTTWLFYAVGFAAAALTMRSERWVQWCVCAYLVLMVATGLFYYPTTFTPRMQTTFAWFENDVYMALLMLALYLGVLRLRGVRIDPRP